jgi:hypothetical protein
MDDDIIVVPNLQQPRKTSRSVNTAPERPVLQKVADPDVETILNQKKNMPAMNILNMKCDKTNEELTSTNNVDSTKNNTLLSNKWNWVFIGLSFVVVVLVILMVYYFVKQNNSAIISNIPNKFIMPVSVGHSNYQGEHKKPIELNSMPQKQLKPSKSELEAALSQLSTIQESDETNTVEDNQGGTLDRMTDNSSSNMNHKNNAKADNETNNKEAKSEETKNKEEKNKEDDGEDNENDSLLSKQFYDKLNNNIMFDKALSDDEEGR